MNTILHIGVVQSAAIRLLPDWIRYFYTIHPGVEVRLHKGNTIEVTAWVLAGVVEIGITNWAHPDLNGRIIYKDDFLERNIYMLTKRQEVLTQHAMTFLAIVRIPVKNK